MPIISNMAARIAVSGRAVCVRFLFSPSLRVSCCARQCSTGGAGARPRWKHPVVLGLAGGTIAVVSTAVIQKNILAASLPVEGQNATIIKAEDNRILPSKWETITHPQTPPSRKMTGPNKLDGLKLTLYQYQTCPFCCKVRAFLDFFGIPYDVVEVDPVLRQQVKFSTYKKVPILLVQDGSTCWQLNDSTVIISLLQSYLLDTSKGLKNFLDLYQPVKTRDASGKEAIEVFNKYNLMYEQHALEGRTFDDIKAEIQWRKWTDDVLVHVLSPNVYRTKEEALQAFNYFSNVGEWEKHFPTWERYLVIYVGATAMYFIGKRLQKKYQLKEDVRQSFYDACNTWLKHVGNSKPFAGGDRPNLADLAVFGVLSSVEGCMAFGDVTQNTKIQKWYDRMKAEVRTHKGHGYVTK